VSDAPSIHSEPSPQQRYEAALASLTARERAFVAHYLTCLSKTKAARQAGYSEKTAAQIGYQLLQKPSVSAAVEAGMDLQAMPASEILARLTRIARGSIADVLRLPPDSYEAAAATLAADGATPLPTAVDSWALDLVKAQQTGAIDLIKSLKATEHGTAFEFYSAHEALRDLAKIRGLFVDRKEITGRDGGAIAVAAFAAALDTAYADDPDNDNQGE
jgi:phage terminase small subunit